MSNVVVFGAQWGDEGKGRFVDYLAEHADAVVRYQGGNNAGHTVGVDGKIYKLRLIPSGILYKDKLNVIANGVVVDVEGALNEIKKLRSEGVDCGNLRISDRAHVVMPYHKVLDELSEKYKAGSGAQLGTTKNGIGPAYVDKSERTGIRLTDLLDNETFPELLKKNLEFKNLIITKVYGAEPLDYAEMLKKYTALAEEIRPYVCDTVLLLNDMAKQGKSLLFEGAQGSLLDVDFGTYPYVTASHPTAVGIPAGTGLPLKTVDKVIGVVKAYTSRVGAGPFATELFDETGDALRVKGGEFGTVTGRPRRIGWLDLVLVNHSARISGMDYIAVTRMDTLAGFDKVKVCTGYKLDGKIIDYYPASLKELSRCEPVFEEFEGWSDSISECRTYEELPPSAKKYLEKIESVTGVKIAMIGVGADRSASITKIDIYNN